MERTLNKSKLVSEIILTYDQNFRFYAYNLRVILANDEFDRFNYANTPISDDNYIDILDELFNKIIAENFEKYFFLSDYDVLSEYVYLITQIIIQLLKFAEPYLKLLKELSINTFNVLETTTNQTFSSLNKGYDTPSNVPENDPAPNYLSDKTTQTTEFHLSQKDIKNASEFIQKYIQIKNEICKQVSQVLFSTVGETVIEGYF